MIQRETCWPLLLSLVFWALPSAAKSKDEIVAQVGRTRITAGQLGRKVVQMAPQVVAFHRRTPAMMKKLHELALDRLIEEALLIEEAARRKLMPSDEVVRRAKARQVKAAGGPRAFARRLAAQKTTWQQHWQGLRRRLALHNVLVKLVLEPSQKSEAQLKAYYAANRARYKRPPEVKVREMLFPVKPDAPATDWDRARAAAAKVIESVKKGADFAELAAAQQHHLAKPPGDGWVHRGRLVPELDAVAFTLAVGAISEPVKTLHGYALIKVEAKRPARQLSYTEVAKKMKDDLLKREIEKRRSALLARLRRSTTIRRF